MPPTDPDGDGTAAVRKLRELADWYRCFAERAGNPAIWDARLRTADDFDAEARRMERRAGIAGCGRLSNPSG